MPVDADEINWTKVPSPISESGEVAVEYDDKADVVVVQKWYWFALMNYIIDTEANIKLVTTKR